MKEISAGSAVCSGQRRQCLCPLFFCCSSHYSVRLFFLLSFLKIPIESCPYLRLQIWLRCHHLRHSLVSCHLLPLNLTLSLLRCLFKNKFQSTRFWSRVWFQHYVYVQSLLKLVWLLNDSWKQGFIVFFDCSYTSGWYENNFTLTENQKDSQKDSQMCMSLRSKVMVICEKSCLGVSMLLHGRQTVLDKNLWQVLHSCQVSWFLKTNHIFVAAVKPSLKIEAPIDCLITVKALN